MLMDKERPEEDPNSASAKLRASLETQLSAGNDILLIPSASALREQMLGKRSKALSNKLLQKVLDAIRRAMSEPSMFCSVDLLSQYLDPDDVLRFENLGYTIVLKREGARNCYILDWSGAAIYEPELD
jgi:hypothetical protein